VLEFIVAITQQIGEVEFSALLYVSSPQSVSEGLKQLIEPNLTVLNLTWRSPSLMMTLAHHQSLAVVTAT